MQIFVFRMDRFLGSLMFDGQGPILVGRHKNAGVRLEGEKISRRHCQIVLLDGQLYVEDLGSGNGTFINRERVSAREPVRATDGVCIGAFTLKVRTLRAVPLAPMDDAAADRTTRVDAILEAERTGGTDEMPVDLRSGSFGERSPSGVDQALYEDALRRQTGRERPDPAATPDAPLGDGVTAPMPPSVGPRETTRAGRPDTAADAPRAEAPAVRRASLPNSEGRPAPTSSNSVAPSRRARAQAPVLPDRDDASRMILDAHEDRRRRRARALEADDRAPSAAPVEAPPARRVDTRLRAVDDVERSFPAAKITPPARVAVRPDSIAIRRAEAAGARRAEPVSKPRLVAEPHLVRPRDALGNDSTMLAAKDLSLRPDSDRMRLDPEVEARLKDLDDLIASLDERYGNDRGVSSVPWRQDGYQSKATPAPQAPVPGGRIVDDSSVPGAAVMSTREFARDLASRLALDGAVVAQPKQGALIIHGEEETEAADAEDVAALAAAALMDDGPETELMDDELPLLREPRLPSIVASTRTPMVERERPPIHHTPTPAPIERRSGFHEAQLLTPTPGEHEALSPEAQLPQESSFYDDVWTNQSLDGEDIAKKAISRPYPKVLVERASPQAERGPKISKHAPPTHVRPQSRIDDFDPSAEPAGMVYDGVEISARAGGRLVDVAVLRKSQEQYILGHRTPQGAVAPGRAHLGLRLLRINDDRSVDLVFPSDVGGHLVRGKVTVMFSELTEGRRYSCLRLEPTDVATIVLGEGRGAITYHIRFLRRPKSLFRSLRRSNHDGAPA